MKKGFVAFICGMFLLSGVAFACPPGDPNCYNAQGYTNFANTFDNSRFSTNDGAFSSTAWYAPTNPDSASANAQGGGVSGFQAYSGGNFGLNMAWGSEDGGSDSNAGAFAVDFGDTSKAGAFASQTSFGKADATSLGATLGEGTAWTTTDAAVFGNVFQNNYVQEGTVGAPTGTWVHAGNFSGAGYEGTAHDQNCDSGNLRYSHSDVDLSGKAFTIGGSEVTRDATGNHRSTDGTTWSLSKAELNGADYGQTAVYGFGSVEGRTGIGVPGQGGNAQGMSQYGYDASTFGFGAAQHSTYANQNGSHVRVGSSGSAVSFSVGAPQGN